jgi:carboxymethylenebutenolidase
MTIAAAAIASTARAQVNVVEKDVEVKTADGTCDAVLSIRKARGQNRRS